MLLSLWLATDVGGLGMWDSYEVVRKMHTLPSAALPATHTPHLRAQSVQKIIRQHLSQGWMNVCAAVNPTLNNRYDDCLSN